MGWTVNAQGCTCTITLVSILPCVKLLALYCQKLKMVCRKCRAWHFGYFVHCNIRTCIFMYMYRVVLGSLKNVICHNFLLGIMPYRTCHQHNYIYPVHILYNMGYTCKLHVCVSMYVYTCMHMTAGILYTYSVNVCIFNWIPCIVNFLSIIIRHNLFCL